ncbi:MAG: hypothetical protein KF884_00930 [Fimbriimonadaceae bacterium]|nr:hypothetical protein [Fimbriimonadaceae bacterium]QYK58660.1 MAG: hypothetical protein KF884_00930 [Fimbriimonadaceae bacterium]
MWAKSLLIFGAAVVIAGCGNVSSSSELAADGSIVQRVRLSVPKAELPSPEPPPALADLVKFAPDGGWKTEESSDDNSKWIEGVRSRGTGEALPMFVVHDKKGAYLQSSCRVEKTADGMLVFTETYEWVREIKNPPLSQTAGMFDELKKDFDKAELTDDQAKAMERELGEMVWYTVFGPSDPLLGLLMTNPAAAEKRMGSLMGTKMIEIVSKYAGDKMTRDEIIAVVREGKKKVTEAGGFNRDKQMSESASEEEPNLMGMLVAIKGPGRMVESNGIYDPIENEVYWSFYDMSAQIGPVVLRAVFQP